MKLLVDENLSRALVPRLVDLFPDSRHVTEVGLVQSSDGVVWEYAKANGFAILTADADFFDLATAMGPPPKVLWLRRWSYRTHDGEDVLRREAIRIAQFMADAEMGLLVIDRE